MKVCPPKDLSDILSKKNRDTAYIEPDKKFSTLLVPVIGSSPSTGFSYGLAGQISISGETATDRTSSISGNLTYTTKNQFMLLIKNNVFAMKNKVFFSGDWRLFLYSQPTYGLGTNAPGDELKYIWDLNGHNTSEDSLVQPMRFDYIKIHQTVSWDIQNNWFVGGGLHYDNYWNIKDQVLDTAAGRVTSHYTYNRFHNFNTEKYTVFGLSANFVYDTRDNLINSYKGTFANFNFRYNPTFLGNDKTSTITFLEFRSFHSLSKEVPRKVIGFWALANFISSGEVPYLLLPALGYDQRGRAGRGYVQGRYRGEDLVYVETEYRFPISKCTGILGGAVFANATTTSNRDLNVELFDYLRAGYGMGLRIMADKKSRTNIQIDVAFGKNSGGFYFGASETF
ncbi:BamA/TamA family outer membrane protein [Flavihumibacter sp. R14]|nr:BamA/TamA family outer membrane protein [Flavihumibacter soli]